MLPEADPIRVNDTLNNGASKVKREKLKVKAVFCFFIAFRKKTPMG
jgi:hypothetical protein